MNKLIKQNRVLAALLSIAMFISVLPAMATSAEPMEVYTEFVEGNSSHSGNGTKESPYNLFEDALNAVADGGTIYILSGKGFVNTDNNLPLQITKNITVASEPGASYRAELSVRKGGIVLGADVTFSNIVLSFANAYRPVICANGYTLTLNNVSYGSSARVIHLAGGSMYYSDGIQSLSPASGSHSRIIVSGSDTIFGNIYAGSINGSFDMPVDITINGVSGSNIGSIYSSGAREGCYNSENFLDPDNEPEAPNADAEKYPVNGNVSIGLSESSIRTIDGKTGGSVNAALEVSAKYQYICGLSNIESLTVKKGTFAPSALNAGANITVQSDGILDISAVGNLTVNDFAGEGGTLIIGRYDCMTVNGLHSGTADFKTPSNGGFGSGMVEYDHLYINTAAASGDGVFTFDYPYPTQPEVTLTKNTDGWRTSGRPEENFSVILTDFDVSPAELTVTEQQINGMEDESALLSVNAEYTEDTVFQDIGMVPLEYTVTYNGTTVGPVQSTVLSEYTEYYEGNIFDFNLNFSPGDNVIVISNISGEYGRLGEIASGVYDIVFNAPTDKGYVSRSVRMTVTGEDLALPTATPTVPPSATPTAIPSATPTVTPSATPTAIPSATPTVTPSATPTAIPSATPTASPSTTPTALPNATSTAPPNTTPTAPPSEIYYERQPKLNDDNTVSYKVVNNSSDKQAIFAVAIYDNSEILKDIKLIIIEPGETVSDELEEIKLNMSSDGKWRTFLWNDKLQPLTV